MGKEGVEGCPQPGGEAGKDSEFVRVKMWPEAAVRKTSRWPGWEGLGGEGSQKPGLGPGPAPACEPRPAEKACSEVCMPGEGHSPEGLPLGLRLSGAHSPARRKKARVGWGPQRVAELCS